MTESLFRTLEQVGATSSRLTKEALLRSLSLEDAAIAKEMFFYTLTPYRHFGIRSLPSLDSALVLGTRPWSDFKELLDHWSMVNTPTIDDVFDALRRFDSDGRKWYGRVLLKDLEIGVSHGTVDKVWPGLVEYFTCMLAEPYDRTMQLKFPMAVEPKIDGVRAVAIKKDGKVTILSRDGKPLYASNAIITALEEYLPADFVVDGELFVESFNKTMQVVKRLKSQANPVLEAGLFYYIFDGMPLKEWKLQSGSASFKSRREVLEKLHELIPDNHIDLTACDYARTLEEINALLQTRLREGFEGVMIKDPTAPYIWGRSYAWLKYKPVVEGDFIVRSTYSGSGRNKHRLGGFVVDLEDGKVCSVGGGFSDQQRNDFWTNPPIGKYIQVEYKERTPDGLLREPVFVRIREDKE